MKYKYLNIKVPVSEEPISRTTLSRKDRDKLEELRSYEGMSMGRYVAKLIKSHLEAN